jgi:hypothetical protein
VQSRLVLLCTLVCASANCAKDPGVRDLRTGRRRSIDGGTTFRVTDDPGCPLLFDHKAWRVPLGSAVPVKPGRHTVGCTGAEFEVDVFAGWDVTFDYWGP